MKARAPLAALFLTLSVATAHAQDSGIDIEQALTVQMDRIDQSSPLDQQLDAAIATAVAAENGVEAASNGAATPIGSAAEAQDQGEREQWGKDLEEESAPR